MIGDLPDPIAGWSPTGDRIAFSRRAESAKFPYELYLMTPDGTGTVVQVQMLAPPTSLAWSPDGERLAYTVMLDGQSTGYLVQPRAGTATRLSSFLTILSDSLVWAADGSGLIAAGSGDVREGMRLFWLDTEHGRPARRLNAIGYAAPGAVAWSGDGGWLAAVTGTFSEPERGLLTVVPEADLLHPMKPVRNLRWARGPRFGPDGQWLAVSAQWRRGEAEERLVLLRPGDPESWFWVETTEAARWPEFSPDGGRLAWVAGGRRVRVEPLAALVRVEQTVP